jgi:uncharacterized cupin superfamily protein
MVPEAPLADLGHGLIPRDDGWFVLNAREARWFERPGRGVACDFEGERDFAQVGAGLYVLAPGEPIGMYHWEADQEDFLILDGDALLLIEGEERPLRRWDFVHCPPGAAHMIVGAGARGCTLFATGAREHADEPGWGRYVVDDVALRHDAGVTEETSDPDEAYARFSARRVPARYRDGSLPD